MCVNKFTPPIGALTIKGGSSNIGFTLNFQTMLYELNNKIAEILWIEVIPEKVIGSCISCIHHIQVHQNSLVLLYLGSIMPQVSP